ncbi:Annexin [Phaffia rhodozyma]|uniref:Annexin n=1 Tax=Phaffia rhodozyma TaxID=264483 RepID=A0A0F7SIG0_PHARH|nr:Annexin [Phaffia rhodozyma]
MTSKPSLSSTTPAIGSQAIYYPPPPSNLPVTPSTCLDISLFKQVIKEWRKADDSIIIRLNRSSARSRDESRSSSSSSGLSSDAGCAAAFADMVSTWSNRATILDYCTSVVDKLASSPASATTTIPISPPSGSSPVFISEGHPADASSWRWAEAGVGRSPGTRDVGRSDGEVLQRRYATERSVEAIVRERSLNAFKSRCPFFEPPASELRKVYELKLRRSDDILMVAVLRCAMCHMPNASYRVSDGGQGCTRPWQAVPQQSQYPPYQGAPPQPYGQPPNAYGQPPNAYGQSGFNNQSTYDQKPSYNQPPPPGAPVNYPTPQQNQYNQYGSGGGYNNPPPQHSYGGFNSAPPQPYGAPPPQGQPLYNAPPPGPPMQNYTAQPAYGGVPSAGSASFFYLGTPILPVEGTTLGSIPPPPGNYNAQFDAERIRKATKGFGTDESALVDTMAPLGGLEMGALSRAFEASVGRSLVKTLEKETRSWFLYGLRGLALGPLEFDCWLLDRACSGIGTHEELLSEILLGRSNNEIYLLKSAYKAIYNKDLVAVVKGELSMKTERMFIMALMGNRDETGFVNQAGIQQDVETFYRAGEGKWGTDEIAILSILVNRSNAHLAAMSQAYFQRNSRPLSAAVSREFSGHMKDGLLFITRGAEQDGDGVARDAEMLEEAMRGMGTKDERLIYRIVRLHWNRQRFENVKRAYEAKYGKSLRNRVQGETSGDCRKLMLAIIQ